MNRLTKNIAQITPGTLFIGIDVGKKRHQVTIMTEEAKVVARFGIDATREGFDRLVNEALSHKERLRGGLHPYDWTDRVRRVWRGVPLVL